MTFFRNHLFDINELSGENEVGIGRDLRGSSARTVAQIRRDAKFTLFADDIHK